MQVTLTAKTMALLLVAVVVLGLASLGTATTDETMIPGGSGSEIVEMACERIEASCIFPDDKLLLRRTAYVESQDGHDPDTYRDGYHGGIWQVDQAFFDTTKSSEASSELYPYIVEINTIFHIDWHIVTWEDCRKPLVSALAARLYIQYTSRDNHNGIPRDIESQADFWKAYYRTTGNVQEYIDKSNALETGCDSTTGADIVFVLDGSGSIGSSHFEDIKEFVKDVIRAFTIGPYKIGVMQYGSQVYPEFELKDYSDEQNLLDAVDDIQYRGGSTYTHLALERLIDVSFLESNGGRPPSAGVPRVGIVLTDGVSSNSAETISEAERAHQAGIIMIAIGVGSNIRESELEAIASEPTCLHLFLLSGFSEIEDLKYAIEKRTCEAPVVIQPGHNGTDTGGRIPPGDNINCQLKIPAGGATISLSTQSGPQSIMYLARDTYPSPVFYEEKLESAPNYPGVAYIQNPYATALSSEWILFCNVIGSNGTETNITFGIRPGDTTHCHSNPCLYGDCVELVDGFRCDCREGYTGTLCDSEIPNPCEPNPCQNGGSCNPVSDEDFTCTCPPGYIGDRCEQVIASSTTPAPPADGYDCGENNPCTPENIEQGNFYFPHHDPDKFVQCDEHGGCFVMPCAPGTIWDPDLNTCNHAP